MASGYGLTGGPNRCYPFWQEVMACYIVNTSPSDTRGAKQCVLQLEDYLECLHHKKERKRTEKLQEAYRKKVRDLPPENWKNAKEVRSLGLLDGPPESKHLNTFGGWLAPKDPKDK